MKRKPLPILPIFPAFVLGLMICSPVLAQGPPGPGGFGPGTFLAPQIVEKADANKDKTLSADEAGTFAASLVRSADEKNAGSIDAQALGRAINKAIGPPPGAGGPDAPPPGDFGPGTFFGPQLFAAADANKDGKLTPEEAEKFASEFIRSADEKKAGGLTSDALAQAINRRMGPMGPPGGMMGQERQVVKDFDKDRDGRLNAEERKAAREFLKKNAPQGRGPFGFGGPGGRPGGPGGGPPGGRPGGGPPGFGPQDEPGKPGPRVAKEEAKAFPGKSLYDPTVLRTLFLDFEDKGWESEMADFNNTDVDLPATLTVDGKTYPNVGVHFRGLSSFMMVREGSKRSMNVTMDFVDPKQKLLGYKALNLLNAHEDNTFLHTVLYFHIARNYLAAPKANFVKVVINGESWGVYVNAQQFDRTFLSENFHTTKGTRWKVPGNPGARGGLEYVGEDLAPYKQRFQIKGEDSPGAWAQLVRLCKVLNDTPAEKLEEALKPILDIDGALWFLALDNALINNDGYWTRSSDYSIYLDAKGKFHIIPHDANETFGNAMMMGFGRGGPGGRPGGPGGGPPTGGPGRQGGGGGPGGPPGFGGPGMGVELDPLIGLDDTSKPLRSKLLAVPSLRKAYLEHVRTIATDWLDWEKLGPVVASYRAVIDPEIEADTRKLMSNDAYHRAVGDEVKGEAPRGRPSLSLREFAEKRRKYLLDRAEIKGLGEPAR